MGKSLYIQNLAQKLEKSLQHDGVHVIIPLHGPDVTPDSVLKLFARHMDNPICCIYHLDISPNVRRISLDLPIHNYYTKF